MVRRVVTNPDDLLVISSAIMDAAESTIVWLAPQSVTALFVRYGIFESAKTIMEQGGSVRGITYVADPYVETVRELVRSGADIRFVYQNPRQFVLMGDGKESISSVSIEPKHLSLESPITAFWTSDANYALWLMSAFEAEWTLSVKSP